MSLRCPRCGREFDVTLFEFEKEVTCSCGETLSLKSGHTIGGKAPEGRPKGRSKKKRGKPEHGIDWASLEREVFGAVNAREKMRDFEQAQQIRARADRISSLILHSDLPRVDVEIEIRRFREYVLEMFPDKEGLLDSVYVNRFRRLWSQFRDKDDPLFGRRA